MKNTKHCPYCDKQIELATISTGRRVLIQHTRPTREGDSPDMLRYKRVNCGGSGVDARDCA